MRRIAALLCGALLGSAAHAQLLEADLEACGDTAISRDTRYPNRFDWLDLDSSAGLSRQ